MIKKTKNDDADQLFHSAKNFVHSIFTEIIKQQLDEDTVNTRARKVPRVVKDVRKDR